MNWMHASLSLCTVIINKYYISDNILSEHQDFRRIPDGYHELLNRH